VTPSNFFNVPELTNLINSPKKMNRIPIIKLAGEGLALHKNKIPVKNPIGIRNDFLIFILALFT
jgi:hypothetical protein